MNFYIFDLAYFIPFDRDAQFYFYFYCIFTFPLFIIVFNIYWRWPDVGWNE